MQIQAATTGLQERKQADEKCRIILFDLKELRPKSCSIV